MSKRRNLAVLLRIISGKEIFKGLMGYDWIGDIQG
jgi:hypothetical protein